MLQARGMCATLPESMWLKPITHRFASRTFRRIARLSAVKRLYLILENWLTNPGIPHSSDPANFDVDYNRNGLRDETPASVSDMTRAAAISELRQLRSATGGLQLITGNAGPFPELALGPT